MMSDLLPWHEEHWRRLLARRQTGSLPHALLLSGGEGLGKNRFAETLAQSLLCERNEETGLPCGACRGCQLYAAGTHPDLRRVAPLEEGKVIGVDQVRELGHYLAHTPQYGARKLVLVSPADKMNVNSANSLLKTLEEPPPYGVLILVSAHPSRLPVTVSSRCQRIHFTSPPPAQAAGWLRAQGATEVAPELLLALADGAPLRARELAETDALNNRERVLDWVEKLARGQTDPVSAAEATLKLGAKETLYCMHSWISDMIRLSSCADPAGVSNEDIKTRLGTVARGMNLNGLYHQLDQVSEALRLIERPLNPQLLLENVLITWQAAFRTPPSATERGMPR